MIRQNLSSIFFPRRLTNDGEPQTSHRDVDYEKE